ncbi:hypothetical protein V8C26DRAFT_388628 [Trichoderma gracile]
MQGRTLLFLPSLAATCMHTCILYLHVVTKRFPVTRCDSSDHDGIQNPRLLALNPSLLFPLFFLVPFCLCIGNATVTSTALVRMSCADFPAETIRSLARSSPI